MADNFELLEAFISIKTKGLGEALAQINSIVDSAKKIPRTRTFEMQVKDVNLKGVLAKVEDLDNKAKETKKTFGDIINEASAAKAKKRIQDLFGALGEFSAKQKEASIAQASADDADLERKKRIIQRLQEIQRLTALANRRRDTTFLDFNRNRAREATDPLLEARRQIVLIRKSELAALEKRKGAEQALLNQLREQSRLRKRIATDIDSVTKSLVEAGKKTSLESIDKALAAAVARAKELRRELTGAGSSTFAATKRRLIDEQVQLAKINVLRQKALVIQNSITEAIKRGSISTTQLRNLYKSLEPTLRQLQAATRNTGDPTIVKRLEEIRERYNRLRTAAKQFEEANRSAVNQLKRMKAESEQLRVSGKDAERLAARWDAVARSIRNATFSIGFFGGRVTQAFAGVGRISTDVFAISRAFGLATGAAVALAVPVTSLIVGFKIVTGAIKLAIAGFKALFKLMADGVKVVLRLAKSLAQLGLKALTISLKAMFLPLYNVVQGFRQMARFLPLLSAIGTVQAIRSFVRTFSEFDEQITRVNTNIGNFARGAGSAFNRVRREILEVAKTTIFTATETAKATDILVRAGLSYRDAIAALGPTLSLAVTSGSPIQDAADILISAKNTFGLANRELENVADTLRSTSLQAQIEVTDIARSVQQAGFVFKQAGLSFEVLNASIQQLGGQNIRGERAGTALRRGVTEIISATGENLDLINQIVRRGSQGAIDNIDFFLDETRRRFRSDNAFLDFLQVVQDSGASIKEFQQLLGARGQLFIGLFGRGGVQGIANALRIIGLDKQLNLAAKQTESIEGSFRSLVKLIKSVGESIQVQLIAPIERRLKEGLQFAFNELNKISLLLDGALFKSVVREFADNIENVAKVVLRIGRQIANWWVLLNGFAVTLGTKVIKQGLLVAERLATKLKARFEELTGIDLPVVDSLQDALQTLQALNNVADDVLAVFRNLAGGLATNFARLWELAISNVRGLLRGFGAFLISLFTDLGGIAARAFMAEFGLDLARGFQTVGAKATELGKFISDKMDLGGFGTFGITGLIGEGVEEVLRNFGDGLSKIAKESARSAEAARESAEAVDVLGNATRALNAELVDTEWGPIWQSINRHLTDAARNLDSLAQEARELKGEFSFFEDIIKGKVADGFDTVIDKIREIRELAGPNFLADIGGAVGDAFSSFAKKAKGNKPGGIFGFSLKDTRLGANKLFATIERSIRSHPLFKAFLEAGKNDFFGDADATAGRQQTQIVDIKEFFNAIQQGSEVERQQLDVMREVRELLRDGNVQRGRLPAEIAKEEENRNQDVRQGGARLGAE
jgi:TP901 family phage tail tape measure protein